MTTTRAGTHDPDRTITTPSHAREHEGRPRRHQRHHDQPHHQPDDTHHHNTTTQPTHTPQPPSNPVPRQPSTHTPQTRTHVPHPPSRARSRAGHRAPVPLPVAPTQPTWEQGETVPAERRTPPPVPTQPSPAGPAPASLPGRTRIGAPAARHPGNPGSSPPPATPTTPTQLSPSGRTLLGTPATHPDIQLCSCSGVVSMSDVVASVFCARRLGVVSRPDRSAL